MTATFERPNYGLLVAAILAVLAALFFLAMPKADLSPSAVMNYRVGPFEIIEGEHGIKHLADYVITVQTCQKYPPQRFYLEPDKVTIHFLCEDKENGGKIRDLVVKIDRARRLLFEKTGFTRQAADNMNQAVDIMRSKDATPIRQETILKWLGR